MTVVLADIVVAEWKPSEDSLVIVVAKKPFR
jgi:hypothetical protein